MSSSAAALISARSPGLSFIPERLRRAVEKPGCAHAAPGEGLFIKCQHPGVEAGGEFVSLAPNNVLFSIHFSQRCIEFRTNAAKRALDVVDNLLLGGLPGPKGVEAFQHFELHVLKV